MFYLFGYVVCSPIECPRTDSVCGDLGVGYLIDDPELLLADAAYIDRAG
jgi:hypothetical protein